jgi:hypothetical protein
MRVYAEARVYPRRDTPAFEEVSTVGAMSVAG